MQPTTSSCNKLISRGTAALQLLSAIRQIDVYLEDQTLLGLTLEPSSLSSAHHQNSLFKHYYLVVCTMYNINIYSVSRGSPSKFLDVIETPAASIGGYSEEQMDDEGAYLIVRCLPFFTKCVQYICLLYVCTYVLKSFLK